jgi:GT2 family glycosyltransferase
MINPFNHPICFSEPLRIVEPLSWAEHIPFAMFIMDILRPRVLVELGTHSGNSYCGFCQAAKDLNTGTKCFAIDTWEGDVHAGIYGPEILADLKMHHDSRYGSFSTLIQNTFDNTVDYFENNSIDLLHIDGLHTYDAVKHDFENWLPKISSRGFVLFHDTNFRERDFGVWKLWLELKQTYPSLEFLHGNGLGVLYVGTEQLPILNKLFSLSGEQQDYFQEFFYILGARLTQAKKIQVIQQANVDLGQANVDLRHEVDLLHNRIIELEYQVDSLNHRFTSRAWKFAVILSNIRATFIPHGSLRESWVRSVYRGLKNLLKARDDAHSVPSYLTWISKHGPSSKTLDTQKNEVLNWDYRPLISVITFIQDTAPSRVSEMICSLTAQTYPNWELHFVNSRPGNHQIITLIKKNAKQDTRIHLVDHTQNLNYSDNLNAALGLSQGEFVSFMNGGDLISPDLFYEAVSLLARQPGTDLIYFDEDIIESNLARKKPWFKPHTWSPELLLSVNFLEHSLIRRSLLDKVGPFDSGLEGARDWDIAFRVTEKTNNIVHIPRVMYHQRALPKTTSKSSYQLQIFQAQKLVIEAHLNRMGISNPHAIISETGIKRVIWKTQGKKVSIIIPNKNSAQLLEKCISSIIDKTIYLNFEILIVDNQSIDSQTVEYYSSLAKNPKIRIIPYDEPFNYSRANNMGAASATGDIFLFLNNDMEVLEPDWLDELVRWTELPEVGAVGTKLLYPDDGKIQHAGVIIGMSGHAHHIHYKAQEHENGIFGSVDWYRNYMAVTGACLMIRRDVFDKVGGFNENYVLAFGDVEICLHIIQCGYRVVYTPFARLIHHEGKSRGANVPYQDMVSAFTCMKDIIRDGDPYFNPNLSYTQQLPVISWTDEPDRIMCILDAMRSMRTQGLSDQ